MSSELLTLAEIVLAVAVVEFDKFESVVFLRTCMSTEQLTHKDQDVLKSAGPWALMNPNKLHTKIYYSYVQNKYLHKIIIYKLQKHKTRNSKSKQNRFVLNHSTVII